MSGGPSVIRRPGTKSNTEFTNSLRANFKAAWQNSISEDATTNGQAREKPKDFRLWTKQEDKTVWIPAQQEAERGLAGEPSQYDITVKLFFLPTTDIAQHAEHVKEAMQYVLQELGVPSINLLIISFPGVTFDADDDVEPGMEDTTESQEQLALMTRTWEALESLHEAGTVTQLGLAEFGTERLKRFLPGIKVRPTLDQINVRDCCVVPRSLITYAKQEKIELMTHNDSTNILPKGTIRELLGDSDSGAGVLCTDPSGALCGEVEPQWVVKYTAVVKDRGVVENKGYFAMAKLID